MNTSKVVKIQVSSNGRATVDVKSFIKSKDIQEQVKKLKDFNIKR